MKKKLDLYWLMDATGSMSTSIDNVKRSISETWGPLGEEYDLGQGAGFYRDMSSTSTEGYGVLSPITTNPNILQTAVDNLQAKGGGATPESQVYALTQVGQFANTIRWRPDAQRMIIWMGDYYGHLNQVVNGITYTTQGAVNALQRSKITPWAFSMDPANMLNSTNGGKNVASSQITTPTGGLTFEHVTQENAIQYILAVLLSSMYALDNASRASEKLALLAVDD